MRPYHLLKEDLVKAAADMAALLATAEGVPGGGAGQEVWEKSCRSISRSISRDRVRVAVVGAIKSGKSTFINALLEGDYLKRGAGVVTSIVTRIRRGEGLKATLCFKSWDEIHADLEHARVLLPERPAGMEAEPFDFRKPECRDALAGALAALGPDRLIQNGTRNEAGVLMDSYLKGYDRVRDIISAETVVRSFEGAEFAHHRDFAGDDALAVYLKDIEIEIDCPLLDANMELADCQGSDSPNPLHLAMIQDYLLRTHLIVYVISSRTGLRRADIRFLTLIRKMGLDEHILFVVNCDFSEHEGLGGLMPLIRRIGNEISLIRPEPRIYTLSALYHLFDSTEAGLSDKERQRLRHWRGEPELASFSRKEIRRFMTELDDLLLHRRYVLLLRNPLEHLTVIAEGLNHRIGVHLEVLGRDAAGSARMMEDIRRREDRIRQLKSLMKNTLDGALARMKQGLKSDVDRFFDVHTGAVFTGMLPFIRQYTASVEPPPEDASGAGFTRALFLLFQEFKHRLDTFLTETTMPEVIRFVREEEEKIADELKALAAPYDGLLRDALCGFTAAAGDPGPCPPTAAMGALPVPELDAVRTRFDLGLPPSGLTLRYSARIRTEAVVRLGCYSLISLLRRLLKQGDSGRKADEMQALKDGVRRMKQETERSVISHFKDYRENLKFQYVLKLADAAVSSLEECLLERFDAYSTDISRITQWAGDHHSDKAAVTEQLETLRRQAEQISGQLKSLREEMTNG